MLCGSSESTFALPEGIATTEQKTENNVWGLAELKQGKMQTNECIMWHQKIYRIAPSTIQFIGKERNNKTTGKKWGKRAINN